MAHSDLSTRWPKSRHSFVRGLIECGSKQELAAGALARRNSYSSSRRSGDSQAVKHGGDDSAKKKKLLSGFLELPERHKGTLSRRAWG